MAAKIISPERPALKQDNWDRIGNKIGDGIMATLLFIGRPFRPLRYLAYPFALIGGGFTGLAGLAVYWWSFAVLFFASSNDNGMMLSRKLRDTIESISFVDAHTAISFAWPGLFIGVFLVFSAMRIGDERGGILDEMLCGILKPMLAISSVLAGAIFFIVGGLMLILLPFALAWGGTGILIGGYGQWVMMSGLFMLLLKIDDM